MSPCRECGCTWLPCTRKGRCVSPLMFRWWMIRHPREYKRERTRIRMEYEELCD